MPILVPTNDGVTVLTPLPEVPIVVVALDVRAIPLVASDSIVPPVIISVPLSF